MLSKFQPIIEQWRASSPRVNGMADKFASIATGGSGVPSRTPLDDGDVADLFGGDVSVTAFYDECRQRFGTFGHHYISSIPFVFHEMCRIGAAATSYLSEIGAREQRPTYFQSIGSAEGVMARTISAVSDGAIHTLSNSSTPENRAEFYEHGAPASASFFSGPYFDISKDVLRVNPEYSRFANGFDIVFEDTCFQMHAPNRRDQIEWVCQNLRDDGLFVCLEKCALPDAEEYWLREGMKDDMFKSRYFTSQQVAQKKATILNHMEAGQVTIPELVQGVGATLGHMAVVWNSGNFYTFVASNNPDRIQEYCRHMLPPCIPPEFQHIDLPKTLLGARMELTFRSHELPAYPRQAIDQSATMPNFVEQGLRL